MPRYIVRRTVEIILEVEATDPKEASRIYFSNESTDGDYHELDLEMWDVTDERNHSKVILREWNI
jgi:hypothetical protein